MLDPNLPVHPQTAVRTLAHYGLQVREDVAFTNAKGEDNRGVRKCAEKTLAKLQTILGQTLEPGEVVLYVVNGKVYAGVIEQLLVGWIAMYLMSVALVFTNRRLLHLRVHSNGAWRGSLSAVAWGDVESARVHGWLNRYLDLKYRNGVKARYWGFRSADKGKLKALLPLLQDACRGEMSPAAGKIGRASCRERV